MQRKAMGQKVYGLRRNQRKKEIIKEVNGDL